MKPTNSIDAEKICFLVFSDDWGEHPSSCQHIFKHIAKQHKVLWVNTIGMRNPVLSLRDLKKGLRKVGKMVFRNRAQQTRKSEDSLVAVSQPPMLPFANLSLVRRINRFLVVNAVKKRLKVLNFTNPILVTTVPNACDYAGFFGEKKKVYYCVDDFSLWPGLNHDLVFAMEQKLEKCCDLFIATSSKLYDRLKKNGKPIVLLSHGVDVDHFRKLPVCEHILLAKIPKPRVGYYGLFDERTDQGLLAEVAMCMPEVSFVITGKVVTDISRLHNVSNIYFTDSVPYQELPSMIAGWDACMLPYQINELTESINPLKLKEYLTSGKPVIASDLPEVRHFARFLHMGRSVDEWIRHLRCILGKQNVTNGTYEHLEFFVSETWGKKAEEFLTFVTK